MSDKAVSLKQVAERAGVSISTVSHVINKTRFVKPETTAAVEQAIKELNYVHNLAARTLRSKKSNIIGVMVSGLGNPYFLEILRGIESVLHRLGYQMILGNTGNSTQEEAKQIELFSSWCVDGIITYGHNYNALSEKYDSVNCPVVCIETPAKRGIDSVLVEERSVVCEAIKDMVDCGYRKIGCIIGEKDFYTSIERKAGYLEALEEKGIAGKDSWIRYGDSTIEGGYREMLYLLEQEDVDAVFAANNLMTLGCVKALSERRIRIPEQVGILGYDDDDWREAFPVTVSSIRPPLFEMGERAARLLLRRIHQPEKSFEVYRISPELIKRESY